MKKKAVKNEALREVKTAAVKKVHAPQRLSAKYSVSTDDGRIVVSFKSDK